MGTYNLNAEYSPTNGGNVYTKTDHSDMHLHRGNDGLWDVNNAADMVADEAGFIRSSSSSHLPLDLEWKFASVGSFQLDPLLTVTGALILCEFQPAKYEKYIIRMTEKRCHSICYPSLWLLLASRPPLLAKTSSCRPRATHAFGSPQSSPPRRAPFSLLRRTATSRRAPQLRL